MESGSGGELDELSFYLDNINWFTYCGFFCTRDDMASLRRGNWIYLDFFFCAENGGIGINE